MIKFTDTVSSARNTLPPLPHSCGQPYLSFTSHLSGTESATSLISLYPPPVHLPPRETSPSEYLWQLQYCFFFILFLFAYLAPPLVCSLKVGIQFLFVHCWLPRAPQSAGTALNKKHVESMNET